MPAFVIYYALGVFVIYAGHVGGKYYDDDDVL